MAYSDRFKDLHHLISNLEYVITDLDDKDKVYAIIDRLLECHNDSMYGREYPRIYLDTEVYAIIDDCGFGVDDINVECGEYRIRVLAELGLLMPTDLHIVRFSIGNFKPEEQNGTQ